LLGTDHILAELIKFGGNTVCIKTHRPINSVWDTAELFQQWKELMSYLFISRV